MINVLFFFFEGLMINILNKVIFGQSDLAIVIIYVHLLQSCTEVLDF